MKFITFFFILLINSVHANVSQEWINKQYNFSLKKIFHHISRADTPKGFIVAAPSKSSPDYYYHWVRDAALVMNALQESLPLEKFKPIAKDYINLVKHHQNISKLSGQGEPKFNPDGTSYTLPWGRPQNDGPALRVLTLGRYALQLIKDGQTEYVKSHLYNPILPARSVLKIDLEYTSHHYNDDDFDLWEEIKGKNFYSKMAQRKALLMGAKIAKKLGDHGAAQWYFSQGQKLDRQLNKFWSREQDHILSTIDRTGGLTKASRLDASSFLAVLHSGSFKLSYNHTDNRVLRTIDKLVAKFKDIYSINQRFSGVAIGRYPEDHYFGGHPWFLLTAGLSEFYYELAVAIKESSSFKITNMNQTFFNKTIGLNLSIQNITNKTILQEIINRLIKMGDKNLNRIRIHSGGKLKLDEQFDRNNGFMTGAPHLTWSYASFITAINARFKAQKK